MWNTLRQLALGAAGALKVSLVRGSDNFELTTSPTATDNETTSGVLFQGVAARTYGYNGAGWDRIRVPNVFKTVSLGSATAETTIWTPTASKKFRLMGFILTCGAASTLTFKDNTAGTTIFIARGTTDVPIVVPATNGILSAAINNVLTVTRGTACTLDGVVFGTEE